MTKEETQKAANKLKIAPETVQTFARLSRRLRKLYEIQANGTDRDKLPFESWEQYDKHREKALKLADKSEQTNTQKVKDLASHYGLYFYLQTDCRGAVLYLSREPISEDYYHSLDTTRMLKLCAFCKQLRKGIFPT